MISVASIWEMQIKLQLGRLRLTLPLRNLIESQQQANNLQVLPIELSHVLALDNLPLHHRDPFDRLLIAQSNVEDAPLVSMDRAFSEYQVQIALVRN
jgi:PIN domain nuclease of toxin-antitoxin system